MSGLETLLCIAVLVTLVTAIWDHQTGLIPNVITYPLLAFGALGHCLVASTLFRNVSWYMILAETLAGALGCALVPYLLWRKNAMGGGDVKLLAGLGAMLGPSLGLQLELYAFLFAALMTPFVLSFRGQLIPTARRSVALLMRPLGVMKGAAAATVETKTELRFGPAVSMAALLVAVLEWP